MAGINRLEQIVTSASDGRQYYRMRIPAGWKVDVHKNPNTYNGYGFPFAVIIVMSSPDEQSGAMYHSTLFYTDDELNAYPEDTVDDFGILHKRYEGADAITALRGDMAFGSMEDLEVLETVRDPAYEAVSARRELEIRQQYEAEPLTVIEKVVYEHVRREYAFKLDGIPYRGCFAATVEAVRMARWVPVPGDIGYSMNNPALTQIIKDNYPNIHYDEQTRQYIYTAKYGTDVHLYGQFACYAPADIYEEEYLNVFNPMIRGGAEISKGLKEEMRINQDVIDRRNRAIREEKRAIAEDNRATEKLKLERGEAIRRELQETADTIRVTWFSDKNKGGKTHG